MKLKKIYVLSVLIALGVFIYLYFMNFDNMSETMLVNSVLYWYVPLIFGLYGLTALRIKNGMDNSDQSVIKHIFSGKDPQALVLVIVLAILSGLIGIVFLLLPITIFKVEQEQFDFKVSLFGALLWLILLYGFFQILWPSL